VTGADADISASRSWWTLIAVCTGTFMLLVDVTIVQIALPTIQHHLGASFTDLQWAIDAYSLGLAALILQAPASAAALATVNDAGAAARRVRPSCDREEKLR
jgi:MFS family permease